MAKVRDYAALAATIGRKKYGKERFAEMADEGRERAKAGKEKSFKPGGGKSFAAIKEALRMRDSDDETKKRRGTTAVRALVSARNSAMKARAARKAGIKV